MLNRFYNFRILSRIWIVAWPTVLYSLMETTVGLVDIFFSSFIGHQAMAAIGFSRQVFLVLMIGTLAITTGTITLVSQYYGARRYGDASAVASHSFLLSIISGIGFGAVGVAIAYHSLYLMGAKGDTLSSGTAYLQVLLGGVTFMLINFSNNAIFRALGDAKTPLKISGLINFLNVCFNYAFAFGFWFIPAYGVMGLAIGTVLSRAIGGIIGLYILTDRNRQVRVKLFIRPHAEILRRLLQIGLPSGISGFIRNGARILFFSIIAATSAGAAAVAAATIGFQVRLYVIMPSLAFQVATAALVGQAIGANKIREAEELGWTTIKLCSTIMAILSLVIVLFPGLIVYVFSRSPEVIELGCLSMRFIALEQFCSCISIVSSGALSGAGDTRPAMRYTIISQWILMLPLAAGLVYYTSFDIMGAWFAWGFAPIVQAALTLLRFSRGHWKQINPAAITRD